MLESFGSLKKNSRNSYYVFIVLYIRLHTPKAWTRKRVENLLLIFLFIFKFILKPLFYLPLGCRDHAQQQTIKKKKKKTLDFF